MKLLIMESSASATNYAMAHGVAPDFFTSGAADLDVVRDNGEVLLIPQFDGSIIENLVIFHILSSEIGLWVTPGLRGQGVGLQAMKCAMRTIADIRSPAVFYATTLTTFGPMARILIGCAFEMISTNASQVLWVYR